MTATVVLVRRRPSLRTQLADAHRHMASAGEGYWRERGWHERLQARVDTALALHVDDTTGSCGGCGRAVPCPTTLALAVPVDPAEAFRAEHPELFRGGPS